MLPNVLIRIRLTKGRNLLDGTRNRIQIRRAITPMKTVMVFQIVMKMNENPYKLLMAFEDDDYMDAIDEDGFYEEISRLKVCLEEKNVIIDTL